MGRNADRKVNGNNDRVRANREPRSKEDWTCKSCTGNKDGKQVPYTNFGHRTECNLCGLSKGVCFGGKCSSDNPSRPVYGAGVRLSARTGDGRRGGETPSFAEKQILRELEAKLARKDKELAASKAEVKKVKAQAAKAVVEGAGPLAQDLAAADVQMEPDDSGSDAVVKAIRWKIQLLKRTPKEQYGMLIGGYEGQSAALQAELAAAQDAKRAAQPLRAQLDSAENWKRNAVSNAEAAKKCLEDKEADLADLAEQVEEQRRSLAALNEVVAAAGEKIALLADQIAADNKTGSPLPAPQPPRVEEVVSLALVNEKWAEAQAAVAAREAEFEKVIANLQAAVACNATGSTAPSDAAPSDVGDLASLESLLEEEKQGKGEQVRERKRALLGRQRDRLAKEVQAGLSGFAKTKVSMAGSPFVKKSA